MQDHFKEIASLMTTKIAAAGLLRRAIRGAVRGTGAVWGAARTGANAAGNALAAGQGPIGTLAGGVAKLTPFAAVAYGGKRAWDSNPSQNLRYQWQLHKAKRMAERGLQ